MLLLSVFIITTHINQLCVLWSNTVWALKNGGKGNIMHTHYWRGKPLSHHGLVCVLPSTFHTSARFAPGTVIWRSTKFLQTQIYTHLCGHAHMHTKIWAWQGKLQEETTSFSLLHNYKSECHSVTYWQLYFSTNIHIGTETVQSIYSLQKSKVSFLCLGALL